MTKKTKPVIICPHCKISNFTRMDDGTLKKEIYKCESCGKIFLIRKELKDVANCIDSGSSPDSIE